MSQSRVGSEGVGDNPHGVRFHLTHAMNVQRFHHRDCGLANFAFLSGTFINPNNGKKFSCV